jgi:hypothetical protein
MFVVPSWKQSFSKHSRAIAHAVSRRLPTAAARVRAQVRSSGICGGPRGTAAGFLEYFGFPSQSSVHPLLHIHYHPSSGTGTIGQLVADVPSGLSLTPLQKTKTKLIRDQFFKRQISSFIY